MNMNEAAMVRVGELEAKLAAMEKERDEARMLRDTMQTAAELESKRADKLSVSLNKALKEKFALMKILSEADEWIQIRKDFTNSFINTEYAEGLIALSARLAALDQEKPE